MAVADAEGEAGGKAHNQKTWYVVSAFSAVMSSHPHPHHHPFDVECSFEVYSTGLCSLFLYVSTLKTLI